MLSPVVAGSIIVASNKDERSEIWFVASIRNEEERVGAVERVPNPSGPARCLGVPIERAVLAAPEPYN